MNAVQIDEGRLAQVMAMSFGESAPVDRIAQKLASCTEVSASGCWLWTGYTQKNGYGWLNVGRLKIAAHRAALILSGTHVPRGMDVCHRCDVRACVNPAHLYVGSRGQNMADCTARGRHNKPTGENHWRAKLSAADIAEIRTQSNNGATRESLAQVFSVNPATISRIARGIWRTEVSL